MDGHSDPVCKGIFHIWFWTSPFFLPETRLRRMSENSADHDNLDLHCLHMDSI